MPRKTTEEMKRFISSEHLDKGTEVNDIIRAFGDKFGFLPSTTTIKKYQKFNETNPIQQEEEEEEEEGGEGKIGAKERDTRLEKDLVDIESIDTDDENFGRLCRNIEKSKHDTFNLLQEALRKGYKKVDVATGDIEK